MVVWCTRLTREIYDEGATFTDEIDTYSLPQWMRGTAQLFVGDASHVELCDGVVEFDDSAGVLSFRFREVLVFNVPVLRPKVDLSGRVLLTRDPATGLITSYVEEWDQSVREVLRSVRL